MTIDAKVYFKKISLIEHSRGSGYNAVLEAHMEGIDLVDSFTPYQIVQEFENDDLLSEMEFDDVISFLESNGYEVSKDQ